MSPYIGIDLHKSKSFVTRINGRGRVLEQVELPHANGALREYLMQLPIDARLAVEATGNWMWLYELIEERHPDLVLAHPLKTKAIASARIKTDKIDATTLAQLLRADFVPAAYIPPRDVRDTREVLRYRASLVRLRTQVKNKIAALVSKTGLQTPTRMACGNRFLYALHISAFPVDTQHPDPGLLQIQPVEDASGGLLRLEEITRPSLFKNTISELFISWRGCWHLCVIAFFSVLVNKECRFRMRHRSRLPPVASHSLFNSQTLSFAGAFPFKPPGTSVLATRVSAYVDV